MWTEQAVETLRRLALEGKSAAWIAAALGAPSRSAVIGKASRIGIRLKGGNGGRTSTGFKPPPPPGLALGRTRAASSGEKLTPRAKEKAVSRVARRLPAISGKETWAGGRVFATAEVGEMRCIGLDKIGELECRWPLGDPTQEDFSYCGLQAAKGNAYCGGHCRLAYKSLTTTGGNDGNTAFPNKPQWRHALILEHRMSFGRRLLA